MTKLAGLFVVGLLLGGCGSTQPAPTAQSGPASTAPVTSAVSSAGAAKPALASGTWPTASVKLASKGSPSEAAFDLAIYRDYFTGQGIQIEPVALDSGPQMLPALSTNQIQAGAGSLSASLFNALNRGVEIRMVADFAHIENATDTNLALLVRKDLMDSGQVKSMADLQGRVIASGTNPGTASDYLIHKALLKDGVPNLKFEVQYLQFPDILAALANKKVDAGTLTEPLATVAQQRGAAKVLYPGGAVIPGAELSLLQFSPQFIQQQPDVATRFMVAYLQGVRDYYDAFILNKGRDAAAQLLSQHTALKNPKDWASMNPTHTDLNGKINIDELRAEAAFFHEQGSLQGDVPDAAKFVDTRFAEAAVKQIGAK